MSELAGLEPGDKRLMAALDVLHQHTGMGEFQLRYSGGEDDMPPLGGVIDVDPGAPDPPDPGEGGPLMPVVWIALGKWVRDGQPEAWIPAAALDPLRAVLALCETVIDGGTCLRCEKPTAFLLPGEDIPLKGLLVCAFEWDAEGARFVRSCEREAA